MSVNINTTWFKHRLSFEFVASDLNKILDVCTALRLEARRELEGQNVVMFIDEDSAPDILSHGLEFIPISVAELNLKTGH